MFWIKFVIEIQLITKYWKSMTSIIIFGVVQKLCDVDLLLNIRTPMFQEEEFAKFQISGIPH